MARSIDFFDEAFDDDLGESIDGPRAEAADEAAYEAWAEAAGWTNRLVTPPSSEGSIHAPHLGPESLMDEAKPRPPSIVEVIGLRQAHYTFVPIFSEMTRPEGKYKAKFWVLDDALKWKVPNSSSMNTLPSAGHWEEPTQDDIMALKHGRRLRDLRRRLWRLPCTAREGEDAARMIRMGQSQLRGSEARRTSRWRKRSLQITAHLYNLRYQQADLKIRPQTGLMPMNIREGLIPASVEYNRRVVAEAHRVFNRDPNGPRLFPELMADPGKVWVIDRKMGRVRKKACETQAPVHVRVAVNHGWHKSNTSRWQTRGTCHGAEHIDYSQICMLVAGWCELKKPGKAPRWVRTWRMYRSTKYAPLVTGERTRLKKHRYNW